MAEVELPNPAELKEKAERAFSRRVALVTAVYAVILAIASLGGNHAMKEMLLAQQQASDQWAFYQAKVIREHQYRAQKMRLEVELADRGQAMKLEVRQQHEDLLKKFAEEEKRYSAEKKDIERDARKLEHERDLYRDKDPYFIFAEGLLQIAIVSASIAILATSRPMFFFSLVLALGGTGLTVNGYTLWFHLPFLHH